MLREAVSSSLAVSVYGDEGIGKSSFVSRFTHLPDADIFPDGIVFLDVLERGLDDLLQTLFEIFYDSRPDFKPKDAILRLSLSEIKALVLLDDLRLPQDKVKPLLNYLPQCAVVITDVERNLWGNDGQAILLNGLPPKDALAFFEQELDRPVEKEEGAAVGEIVKLLHGHPGRITWTASQIRKKSRRIPDVLSELQAQNPEQALLNMSLDGLTEFQKRDLAILAASGGASVPLEHLASLSKDDDTRKSLEELIDLRLVQAHSPSYSLTGELTSLLASRWSLDAWEDRLIDYFTSWLESRPAQPLIEASVDVLLQAIKKAGERKRWQNVIRMGRTLERYLALWKRWQAWGELLSSIGKAAKAIGDRKIEAWALHQLGSRALCLEHVEGARKLLTQALNIRQAIGDQAGLEITRHNLNLLPKLAPTKVDKNKGCRRCCTTSGIGIGASVILGFVVVAFVVAKAMDFIGGLGKDRFARFAGAGMRWSRAGLTRLLPVRTAILSKRFDMMWSLAYNSPQN